MDKMTKIDWDKPKYPNTFVFKKEGDVLEGIVKKTSAVLLGDRTAKFLNIETENGLRTLWFGAVLESQLEEVKKGDYIGVKYLGEVKGTGINPYKDYDVRIIPFGEGIDTTNIPEGE